MRHVFWIKQRGLEESSELFDKGVNPLRVDFTHVVFDRLADVALSQSQIKPMILFDQAGELLKTLLLSQPKLVQELSTGV
jgi:hypothetical protein